MGGGGGGGEGGGEVMMMLCAVTENKQSSGTASTLQHHSLYYPVDVTTSLKGATEDIKICQRCNRFQRQQTFTFTLLTDRSTNRNLPNQRIRFLF